jgi:CheY-like chemotaxis protein
MPEEAVILIAEDLMNDRFIIHRAFQEAQISNPLQFVRDGEEAIAYLAGEGKYANRAEYPLPELMLLDLKMPKVDGFEVLEWIRAQPGLHNLRVVVLTASDEIRDVNKAYDLGASSFLVKPNDFTNVINLARTLATYWLQANKAPTTARKKLRRKKKR